VGIPTSNLKLKIRISRASRRVSVIHVNLWVALILNLVIELNVLVAQNEASF